MKTRMRGATVELRRTYVPKDCRRSPVAAEASESGKTGSLAEDGEKTMGVLEGSEV